MVPGPESKLAPKRPISQRAATGRCQSHAVQFREKRDGKIEFVVPKWSAPPQVSAGSYPSGDCSRSDGSMGSQIVAFDKVLRGAGEPSRLQRPTQSAPATRR